MRIARYVIRRIGRKIIEIVNWTFHFIVQVFITQITFKDTLKIVDKLTGILSKILREVISLASGILVILIKYTGKALTISENIMVRFSGTLQDILKIQEIIRGIFTVFKKETIQLFKTFRTIFILRVRKTLNLSDSILTLLSGILKDTIHFEDIIMGSFSSFKKEYLLFKKYLQAIFYLTITKALNLEETFKLHLTGIFQDIVFLKDTLLGQFETLLQEYLIFNKYIQLLINLIGHKTLVIIETIKQQLSGVWEDKINVKEAIKGIFSCFESQIVSLNKSILLISTLFTKKLMNLTEVVYKQLSGTIVDTIYLKEYIKGTFEHILSEFLTVTKYIELKCTLTFGKILNLEESIKKQFAGTLKEITKIHDYFQGLFKRICKESLIFTKSLLLSMFLRTYRTITITETIKRQFSGFFSDFNKVYDYMFGMFQTISKESISLKAHFLIEIAKLYIETVVQINENISTVFSGLVSKDIVKLFDSLKGIFVKKPKENVELYKSIEGTISGATIFDKYKFDTVTFDSFTKEI